MKTIKLLCLLIATFAVTDLGATNTGEKPNPCEQKNQLENRTIIQEKNNPVNKIILNFQRENETSISDYFSKIIIKQCYFPILSEEENNKIKNNNSKIIQNENI